LILEKGGWGGDGVGDMRVGPGQWHECGGGAMGSWGRQGEGRGAGEG
jgi:hypothetical protein